MESTESLSSNSGNPTPVMSELSLPEPIITGEHYTEELAMNEDIVMTTDEPPILADESAVDVSRAGRKRKANTRYMDEPSPVAKPVSRRSSGATKKKPVAAVSSVVSPKSRTVSNKATSGSSTPAEEVPTGPPAFSQFLFKNRKGGRKMSEDTFSEDGHLEEEYLPDIVTSDDEEEEEIVEQPKKPVSRTTSRSTRSRPVEEVVAPEEKKMMEGVYEASGLIGPIDKIVESAKMGNLKIALQSPSNDKLPNVIPMDENGERVGFVTVPPPSVHVPIFAEIAGGPLSLIPKTPVFWLRDEVPKLSAYFKKKMMSGPSEPAAPPAPKATVSSEQTSGPALVRKLSEEEKAAKRRKKEEERRKLIEDRAQRRERERLKQLYRQHWLALTKFPIDDNLLHSRKGIRRLGHAQSQCRQIATPIVYWDCLLGEPGTFDIPLDISPTTTALIDEIFVVWNFFHQFGSLMCPPTIRQFSFSLPQLVQAFTTRECHPLISSIHEWILGVLRPFALYEIDTLLSAEQAYESQLVKNRGRAKLYWPTFSEFRDFLFLGHCVLKNELKSNWLWLSIFLAKSTIVLDPVDPRRDFLASVSGAFEEIDFEHKWLFDLETNGSGFMYESIGFADRLRLVRILLNKISALPWSKLLVDKFCDARIHISSELVYIEKEERKSNQKIAHCQKLQSILSSGEPPAFPITLPMTPEELKSEIEFRDSLSAAKKIANTFVDSHLAVRLESIGKDRFFNEYFQISSMKKIVFVRQHSVTHPNVVRYGIYDSLSNLELLIQSLDDRGVREHALKTELQKIKANLFSDLVASTDGEIDVNQTVCDWLSESVEKRTVKDLTVSVGPSQDSELVLAPLAECVDVAKEVMTMIRSVWYGLPHKKRKPRNFRTVAKSQATAKPKPAAATAAAPVVAKDEDAGIDDDDVTVEEEMSDVEPPEVKEEEKIDEEDKKMEDSSGDTTPLDEEEIGESEEGGAIVVNERLDFCDAIAQLAETVSESINNSLLGFQKPDETTTTASSVLIQFHIKNGNDLLRHLNIPYTEQDIERKIDTVIGSREKIVDFSGIILDGLLAMDEVVHDELARHEGGLEVWPTSGGEKHAWRKFVGYFKGMEEGVVPGGEEEETERTTNGSFSCETCGKQFKYHILLGVHKLHPCKTRGRKPIPVEPFMDIKPVPLKNGMIAIDKMVLPTFPPPPSSRASVAAAATVAAAAAAVVPQEGVPEGTTTGEYVCELCGKVFPHNQGLAVHQTRWCIPEQQAQLILTAQQAVGTVPSQGGAEEGSPLPCPTCGKLFPTAQGLAIHLNRWCSGAVGDGSATQVNETVREPPKVAVPIGPLFRNTTQAEKDKLIKVEIEEQDTTVDIEDEPRHPGYTPACYSLSALSIAVLWYSNRFRAVLESFTATRSHPSRGGNKSKRK